MMFYQKHKPLTLRRFQYFIWQSIYTKNKLPSCNIKYSRSHPCGSALDVRRAIRPRSSRALSLGRQIWREGYAYKRAKNMLLDTVSKTAADRQKTLFELDPKFNEERREKEHRLMQAVDQINRGAGQGRLFFAAEGTIPAWQPNRAFVSPCYTTRWEDIPTAK